MNNLEIQSLSQEKVSALRTLSDEIYPLLRNAELAKFIVGDLLNEYFGGDEPDGSPKCAEKLMCGYRRAQTQVQILMDYLHSLKTSLELLDQVASKNESLDSGSAENLLLDVLVAAAGTGKVSSKELGQLLRTLSSTEGV